jgi:hypothetical protein
MEIRVEEAGQPAGWMECVERTLQTAADDVAIGTRDQL